MTTESTTEEQVTPDTSQLKEILSALGQNKHKRIRRIFKNTHPAKIASIIETVSAEERTILWQLLESNDESKVLAYLSPSTSCPLDTEKTDEESGNSRNLQVANDITPLEVINASLSRGKLKKINRVFNGMHSARIAGLLESLPPKERKRAWEMVDEKKSGKVLVHLHKEVRMGLIRETDMIDLVIATRNLALDDLVNVIREIPQERAKEFVNRMESIKRDKLRKMLSYDPDCAGGLMDTDHIAIRADVTIKTVLRYLRLLDDLPDHTDKLMVVDRKGRYLGVVRIRNLVTSDVDLLIEQIMLKDFVALYVGMSRGELVQHFEDSGIFSAPVVDESGKLIGRITVDDVIDEIKEQADSTLMNMAGLESEDDMFASVFTSARRRAIWLGINLVTAFLAAWVIGQFEATLEKVVALAVLMPIVASMGGIAGSQTLTLMIRGLALGHIERGNTLVLMRNELAIGALNGILWALVVALLAFVWFKSLAIGGIIAAAILLNLVCAALAGVAVPLALKKMGVDPALAGSVILTTVTDVVGFLAFLGLATVFLLS